MRWLFPMAIALLFVFTVSAASAGDAGNTIEIDGVVNRNVYGNSSRPDGYAGGSMENLESRNNNTVLITAGGEVRGGEIFGGYARDSDGVNFLDGVAAATGNAVSIKGGTVTTVPPGAGGTVHGGMAIAGGANSAVASGNTVTIEDGGASRTVLGGRAAATGSGSASASNNIVTITNTDSGGANTAKAEGDIIGGLVDSATPGAATATGNTVTLNGDIFFGPATNVYGGLDDDPNTAPGDIFTGNTLNLNSKNVISKAGNFATINFGNIGVAGIRELDTTATGAAPGTLVTLNANGNTVGLSGMVTGSGGIAKTGPGILTLSVVNSYTGMTDVREGTLALLGFGTLGDGGSGGLSLSGDRVTFDFSSSDDRLSIPVLSVSALDTVIRTGPNTLDLTNSILHFDIPRIAGAGSTLLTVDGNANMSDTTVNLTTSTGRPGIDVGETVNLLRVVNGEFAYDSVYKTVTQGGDVYTVRIDDGTLEAVLEEISADSPLYDRLKAYAESRVAELAFLNQGQDFVLTAGFGSALGMTSGAGRRVSAFGGAEGGRSRYRSGSHVDVSGASFLAGIAFANDVICGRFTGGAFFEGGIGKYDSYNSFANSASVAGDGGTSYLGGGVLGRYDVVRGAFAGVYFGASARVGRAKTDFRTEDIQYNGWKTSFDAGSLYHGLHGGVGFARGLGAKASVDFSANVLWTRQEGENLTVYQDDVRFEDADSLRVRAGGRYSYAVDGCVAPYAGAYWEHEFAGNVRSTVDGKRIVPPSLRGDSGIVEIGFSYRQSGGGLSVDAGARGYVGKRRGVAGSLRVSRAF